MRHLGSESEFAAALGAISHSTEQGLGVVVRQLEELLSSHTDLITEYKLLLLVISGASIFSVVALLTYATHISNYVYKKEIHQLDAKHRGDKESQAAKEDYEQVVDKMMKIESRLMILSFILFVNSIAIPVILKLAEGAAQ